MSDEELRAAVRGMNGLDDISKAILVFLFYVVGGSAVVFGAIVALLHYYG